MKRANVLLWLKQLWDEFPVQIVQNSFKGCGYAFEYGIDYSGDTDSESDEE